MTINLLDSTNTFGEKYAIIELDMKNIYDIINGLLHLVDDKEIEIRKNAGGDNSDQQQLERYKQCLKEMQEVKAKLK